MNGWLRAEPELRVPKNGNSLLVTSNQTEPMGDYWMSWTDECSSPPSSYTVIIDIVIAAWKWAMQKSNQRWFLRVNPKHVYIVELIYVEMIRTCFPAHTFMTVLFSVPFRLLWLQLQGPLSALWISSESVVCRFVNILSKLSGKPQYSLQFVSILQKLCHSATCTKNHFADVE